MNDIVYITTDLAEAVKRFGRFHLAGSALLPEDQITSLQKTPGGLLLKAVHPELQFSERWENAELARLPLADNFEFQVSTEVVLQLIKGFSKEAPLELGVAKEGLHLRNGENVSVAPWLAYHKLPPVEAVDDLLGEAIPPEKPTGELNLSFLSKQVTRLKSLLKCIPAETLLPTLSGLQIRYRGEEPLVFLAGNGNYFADWCCPVQSGWGQGLLHLSAPHAEFLVACLESLEPLQLQVYARYLTLKGSTLEARVPLRDKAFPSLRKFQTIRGEQQFQGEAKQFDQALKGLLPLSDDLLPVLEMVRHYEKNVTFQLYQGGASQGTVEVEGSLENFRYLIRSDFLKEIKRLLKGKIWTWTALETEPEILRVEDDQVRFWFRPMLDPRSDQQIAEENLAQRRQEALEEAELGTDQEPEDLLLGGPVEVCPVQCSELL